MIKTLQTNENAIVRFADRPVEPEFVREMRKAAREIDDYAELRKMVDEKPDEALALFHLIKDAPVGHPSRDPKLKRDLGRLFVHKYANNNDYHHSAYFVSVELGEPIQRRKNETLDLGVATPGGRLACMGGVGIVYYGSTKDEFGPSWGWQNRWDNAAKACEDSVV